MKKTIRSYDFEFDKGERRIINAFCKQILKQVAGIPEHFKTEQVFNSVSEKINGGEDVIRLTKNEYMIFGMQLKSNIRYLNDKMDKAWFIKKWIFKSLRSQYALVYEKHFKE